MRIGVYVDGFNLYYGARGICGRGTPVDQDIYLKALVAAGSVDHIEYGTYVARVKTAPLAVKDRAGRPKLVAPSWPVMIQDDGGPVTEAVFMVSYANREEKGTDVNVASHLLMDVLTGRSEERRVGKEC